MTASAEWSEFAAAPVRVLVHDPAETPALSVLRGVPPEEMQRRFLFRAEPCAEAFSREHRALVAALEASGATVVRLLDVVADNHRARLGDNPNYVYTRDPAIVLPWLPGRFLRGRMRKPVRRGEPEVLANALESLGLTELPTNGSAWLEGGDVIPFSPHGRRTLLVGFGPRTSRVSLTELCEALMPDALDEVLGIELAPERMNLDGALVPVAEDLALVEPTSIVSAVALDERGERPLDVVAWLREVGIEPLTVSREEAVAMQACNTVCVGARRVVVYELCERVAAELRRRDVDVTTVPGSELIKGTGGPRCMTRPLYS